MVAIHYGAFDLDHGVGPHADAACGRTCSPRRWPAGVRRPGQPVGSAGAAITHFRDDTEDVAKFVDGMVDVSGGVVFTVFAGIVLGMADARAAAVLLLPLVGVAVATRTLDNRIKVYRAADRAATAEVTGLVGDVMAAATTVKVNDATEPLLARLQVLVDGAPPDGGPRPGARRERCRRSARVPPTSGFGLVLLVSAPGDRLGHVRRRRSGAVHGLPRLASRSCRGWSGACSPAASRPAWRSTGCGSWSPTSDVAEHGQAADRSRSERVDMRERPDRRARRSACRCERLDVVAASAALHDGGAGVRDVVVHRSTRGSSSS